MLLLNLPVSNCLPCDVLTAHHGDSFPLELVTVNEASCVTPLLSELSCRCGNCDRYCPRQSSTVSLGLSTDWGWPTPCPSFILKDYTTVLSVTVWNEPETAVLIRRSGEGYCGTAHTQVWDCGWAAMAQVMGHLQNLPGIAWYCSFRRQCRNCLVTVSKVWK